MRIGEGVRREVTEIQHDLARDIGTFEPRLGGGHDTRGVRRGLLVDEERAIIGWGALGRAHR